MVSRARLLIALLAMGMALLALPPVGGATELNRIAAVVNDEAISVLDVQMRLRMVQVTANIADSEEARKRLLPQVLRKLIDERLAAQEAARLKISVSKEDVIKQVGIIEQQNRMPAGALEALLKKSGVPVTTLYRQVEAEMLWAKVVRTTLASRSQVGEDEVKAQLEMLQSNIGQPEYLLAEILLPVESPDKDDEVKRFAERVIEQLRRGTSFQTLARQFSQSATAAAGGDMEWVPVSSLEPEAARVLAEMQPGSLTPPIRVFDGYQVLLLRGKRIFGEKATTAAPNNDIVAVAQLFVPAGGDPREAAAKLEGLAAGTRNCNDMVEVARKHKLPQSGRGNAKLSQMSKPLRQIIEKLELFGRTKVLVDQSGARIFMLCGKGGAPAEEEADTGLPTPEKLKTSMERQRLEMLAQRHLRDLKRAALIDIKD